MKAKKYKINKGYISQDIENKTVIFDSEHSILFTFNETAAFIFKRLSQGHETDKIVKALAKSYDVTENVARKDVDRLIATLLKKKIIS